MHFTRKNHTFILIAAFVLSFSLAATCSAQAPPPGGPEGFGDGADLEKSVAGQGDLL